MTQFEQYVPVSRAIKPKKFDPYEGLHTIVPSKTTTLQTIEDGEVTGYFVCTRVDCWFGGSLKEGIAHAIHNQVKI